MSRSDLPEDRARNNKLRALFRLPGALALSAIVLSLPGCLSRGDSDSHTSNSTNHPPVVKLVSILPSPLTLAGPLTVRVEAQDPDLNIINFRYRWSVNGNVLTGQTRESLPPELLKRGDQVVVEVTPFDGTVEGTPFRSVSVPVMNTAPILSHLTVDIDHEAQGARLLAKVDVVDPDNDPVSLIYRWRKDEKVLKEGEDNTLPITGVTAKDLIQVDVIASDGNTDGAATLSARFTMSNSSPTIVSKPSLSPNGNLFEYLVQASDPDGDPITYGLEVSPPGMTIDEKTGRISWMVTPEAKGSYRIKVIAKDSQGGFASQEFDLSVNAPSRTS